MSAGPAPSGAAGTCHYVIYFRHRFVDGLLDDFEFFVQQIQTGTYLHFAVYSDLTLVRARH